MSDQKKRKPHLFQPGNKAACKNTLYKAEYDQMLIDWFSVEPTKEIELPHFKGQEIAWIDKKLRANPLPRFDKFADYIGVWPDTLNHWCSVHPSFSKAHARAKELQKYFLAENALNGTYNPQFSIFLAKNITDLKDVIEIDETKNVNVNFYLPDNQRVRAKLQKKQKKVNAIDAISDNQIIDIELCE